ncbi:hypothetical protein NDU88_006427 [Pleurodeles waltl]|uniref:Uncharacterized protein n=1 Tax=Pleurodeles waltl TaxID=8319 RepID=A0AAV7QLA3_PLEWA|nr:hypothetical protein NDU88_006427 [Pleurodeles waltl]
MRGWGHSQSRRGRWRSGAGRAAFPLHAYEESKGKEEGELLQAQEHCWEGKEGEDTFSGTCAIEYSPGIGHEILENTTGWLIRGMVGTKDTWQAVTDIDWPGDLHATTGEEGGGPLVGLGIDSRWQASSRLATLLEWSDDGGEVMGDREGCQIPQEGVEGQDLSVKLPGRVYSRQARGVTMCDEGVETGALGPGSGSVWYRVKGQSVAGEGWPAIDLDDVD